MKTLIIYDSLYGNTENVAKNIGSALKGQKQVIQVGNADISMLKKIDLLIIGAPTHGGRPSPPMQRFLDSIPDRGLHHIGVAAFDTRISATDVNPILRLLLKTFGYAAPKIANMLKSKGGSLVALPQGFIVKGKEGPLAPDVAEKVHSWTQSFKQKIS